MARVLALVLAVSLALPGNGQTSGRVSTERRETVPAGSSRAGDLVALSRTVEIDGELQGTLVAIGGPVRVSGRITGDLIAILAPVELTASARIGGDLLALGSDLHAATPGGVVTPGALVQGRVLSVSALEAAFLSELRTSPLQPSSAPLLLVGFRLVLLFFWLLVALGLLFAFPRRLLHAASSLPADLPLVAGLGALSFVAALLISAFLLSALPARFSLPLVALLVGSLLASKAFGLAALFVALGQRLLRSVPRSSPLQGPSSALACGLLALGLASLVPFAGAVLWSLASLAAIGVSLRALRSGPG